MNNNNKDENKDLLNTEYKILQTKFNSVIWYLDILKKENVDLKYENLRLKNKLSLTSRELAEKERLFLLLKTSYNNK